MKTYGRFLWGQLLGIGCIVMGLLATHSLAGQPKPKIKHSKSESSIAEMTSRATAIDWHAHADLKRLTVVITTDQSDEYCVMGLAEFDNGQLGIYQSRQDPDKDRFFLIQKNDLDAVEDAVCRCRR